MSHRLVLVIEDESDLQFLWRTILEREGFRVIEASDGRNGLILARAESPDVIILDGQLPDISGWDVLDSLADDPGLSHTHVLMVTADTAAISKADGRGLPRDHFLTKPLKVQDLICRPSSDARRARLIGSHKIDVGNHVQCFH